MKYYVILGITRYMVPVAIWYLPQMSAVFVQFFWFGMGFGHQSSQVFEKYLLNLLLLLQDLDMRYNQNLDTKKQKKK